MKYIPIFCFGCLSPEDTKTYDTLDEAIKAIEAISMSEEDLAFVLEVSPDGKVTCVYNRDFGG